MAERLEMRFVLSCDPKRAFRAFTEKVDRWWPKGHRSSPAAAMAFEPGSGGRLVERSDGGERAIGEVLSWIPPGHLSFDWRLGATNSPTRVEISFEEKNGGTKVTVLHTPSKASVGDIWSDTVARFERGWLATFAALSEFLTNQETLR